MWKIKHKDNYDHLLNTIILGTYTLEIHKIHKIRTPAVCSNDSEQRQQSRDGISQILYRVKRDFNRKTNRGLSTASAGCSGLSCV